MAPKKREKELDKNRMDHAQADHELFLQAFESKLETLLKWILDFLIKTRLPCEDFSDILYLLTFNWHFCF